MRTPTSRLRPIWSLAVTMRTAWRCWWTRSCWRSDPLRGFPTTEHTEHTEKNNETLYSFRVLRVFRGLISSDSWRGERASSSPRSMQASEGLGMITSLRPLLIALPSLATLQTAGPVPPSGLAAERAAYARHALANRGDAARGRAVF